MDSSQQASDSLISAHEMGRLDFVTALLAAITILLALGGVFAFVDVRRSARRISEKVAEREARTVAEATAVEYLERELPKLWSEYQELARGGVEANKIAQAQDELEGDRHDPV